MNWERMKWLKTAWQKFLQHFPLFSLVFYGFIVWFICWLRNEWIKNEWIRNEWIGNEWIGNEWIKYEWNATQGGTNDTNKKRNNKKKRNNGRVRGVKTGQLVQESKGSQLQTSLLQLLHLNSSSDAPQNINPVMAGNHAGRRLLWIQKNAGARLLNDWELV